jgi:hypothetical protein
LGLRKIYLPDFTDTSGRQIILGRFFAATFSKLLNDNARDFAVISRIDLHRYLANSGWTDHDLSTADVLSKLVSHFSPDAILWGSVSANQDAATIDLIVRDPLGKELFRSQYAEKLNADLQRISSLVNLAPIFILWGSMVSRCQSVYAVRFLPIPSGREAEVSKERWFCLCWLRSRESPTKFASSRNSDPTLTALQSRECSLGSSSLPKTPTASLSRSACPFRSRSGGYGRCTKRRRPRSRMRRVDLATREIAIFILIQRGRYGLVRYLSAASGRCAANSSAKLSSAAGSRTETETLFESNRVRPDTRQPANGTSLSRGLQFGR